MRVLNKALILIAALLVSALAYKQLAPKPLLGGTGLDTHAKLPSIALISSLGKPEDFAKPDKKVRLVFFGFVRCPDVCPATLSLLNKAYEPLSPEQKSRLKVQLVSVDPDFDKPAVLNEYLGKFNPNFSGLTGSKENINKAAEALFVSKQDTMQHEHHHASESGADSAAGALIHGDQVSIVNSAGEFVRVYTNSEVLDGTLQKDIPKLIDLYSS